VQIDIVDADPRVAWPRRPRRGFAARRRRALGTACDHIGSTSVSGLAATPIIDILMTVDKPSLVDSAKHPARLELESVGFVWMGDNDDRRRRFLRLRESAQGWPDVNLHVRRDGCVSQQQALLFRDYLRADEWARRRYGQKKRRLAQRESESVDDHADAKGDVVWALLREADVWSWSGWGPGPSDG
jgi:GrpB-like predicted nucleotidyltransferase (UPF0157 family)